MCLKDINVSIRRDTLSENCSTCFLIYQRKASLDHLPYICMYINNWPALAGTS